MNERKKFSPCYTKLIALWTFSSDYSFVKWRAELFHYNPHASTNGNDSSVKMRKKRINSENKKETY